MRARRGRPKPETVLAEYLDRNGCIRRPDAARRESEKSAYKKGYEVRLTARNAEELEEIRELLERVGIEPARSYTKGLMTIQPVYGKAAADRFVKWVAKRQRARERRSIHGRKKSPV